MSPYLLRHPVGLALVASLAAVDLTLRALLGDRLPEAVNERARRPSVPPGG